MTQRVYDVAVVGSGGPGLVAASAAAGRGLNVVVLESTSLLGGTTALSGGQLWIPCSGPMRRAGFDDSPEAALEYLERLTMGMTPRENLEEFVDQGSRFIDYLEGELGLRLQSIERPDYHPEWKGAARGRSLEPLPVETGGLGIWREQSRTSPTRRPVTGPESRSGIDGAELRRREAQDVRTQGAGLIAGLVHAAVQRDVEIRVNARVTSAHRSFGLTMLGVNGGESTVAARSVVLAAGGFARHERLLRDFLPPVRMVPTAAPGSMGDGLHLGAALGGRLKNMGEAWWTAAASLPGEVIDGRLLHRNLVRELAYPGSVLVNAGGRRFVNEASSYNDLGKAFMAFDAAEHTYPNERAWLVFDAAYRNQRPVAGIEPGARTQALVEGLTLGALARSCGIDADALEQTVLEHNRMAEHGDDTLFHRGGNEHDRFNGDSGHRPNPCLGPILEPPFYALPVTLGINGTKGGLAVDGHSRVLGHNDQPVEALFAVGESAAALMGPGYAGSGASLGPSMTAAYALSEHLPPPHTASGRPRTAPPHPRASR